MTLHLWKRSLILAMVLLLGTGTCFGLVPSIFGEEMEQLWRDQYNRDLPTEELQRRADSLWQRTSTLTGETQLREQVHLLFFKGVTDYDYKLPTADAHFAQAEALWRKWLALDPSNGRVRAVGVEIRTFRLLTKGWLYTLANALPLDGDLQRAHRDAPNDVRVGILAAMKFHYAPGIAGGSIPRALELLSSLPIPTENTTRFLYYYELAQIYKDLKKKDTSILNARKALEVYPRSHLAQKVIIDQGGTP